MERGAHFYKLKISTICLLHISSVKSASENQNGKKWCGTVIVEKDGPSIVYNGIYFFN